jgi:hypothetical protein
MKTIYLPILAALACFITVPPTWAEAQKPAGFDHRRQAMLDAAWADYQEHRDKPSSRQRFWIAEALFELGKTEDGCRMAGLGLNALVPGNKENRWMYGGNSGFVAWPGMDCYVRYQQFMDEALKKRFKDIYTGAVFYPRLSTSNHKIMAAVTRFLATEAWGAGAFKPDPFFTAEQAAGNIFNKSDPTGEKYVRSIIKDTVKYGPGEYASRPYGAENVLPLLALAEGSRDPEIRRKALLAYELSLIQLAPAYLAGHLATFSPRSYPDMESQRPSGVAALLWVYFGGVPPDDLPRQWAMRAATAKYRLPKAVLPAGTDRSQPYVFRSLANKWALYHYVNRRYVLFSRSPKAASGQFMGQSYPCGVMWEEPDTSRCSHLWVTCPAADDNNSDKNNPSGLHTHGVTKFEQQVQHKDASVSAFNIPTDFRNPYVLVFVPGGYRAAVNDSKASRRIFLHYGSVLIAVSSAQPFEWNPQSGIRAPAGKPPEGASEFRVMSTKTAVAVETALPEEFPGKTPGEQLEKFRQAVLAKSRVVLKDGEKTTAVYTDCVGNVLECTYDGEDKVNGRTVDYKNWPAFESPWTSQPQGGNLVVTGSGLVRTYDFKAWAVSESK